MDEKQIVTHILSGDEPSLRKFYHIYQPRLFSFIRAKVGNEHDAEEILQDVFLATLEALRDFSFRSSLYTFICSIAVHKIIDYYRKKKIKQVVFSKFVEIEPILSTLLGPESTLDEVLLREKIRKTFGKLAPNQSKILRLKYIYGYSVEEIAKKLAISFKSAESLLFRARRAFVLAYSV
ncbi:RNA polymerase sigma factor [Candidatus Gottesmanbacteria bacterium]|nr:RNA polymerase sigma factor [Candidatus Gottesmanbacteria bacterium]